MPVIGGLRDHKSRPHWRSSNLSCNAFKELCDDARLNDVRLRSRRLNCSAFLLDYGIDYEIAKRNSGHSDNLQASNLCEGKKACSTERGKVSRRGKEAW